MVILREFSRGRGLAPEDMTGFAEPNCGREWGSLLSIALHVLLALRYPAVKQRGQSFHGLAFQGLSDSAKANCVRGKHSIPSQTPHNLSMSAKSNLERRNRASPAWLTST